MRTNIEKNHPKIAKLLDWGFYFGNSCLNLSRCRAFLFATCFRTFWESTTWTDFGIPWGTLGPIFLTYWKMRGPTFFQNGKIPEQQIAPTTPSKKKQSLIKNVTDD